MKEIVFIVTILLTSITGYAQINIFGLFVNQDGAFRQLDLKSDSSYILDFDNRCGGKYRESGKYKVISDTIYLLPNDTVIKPTKYLYISHLPADRDTFWTWDIGTLAQISFSDSILPMNQIGRLTDHDALSFGSYFMKHGYHTNGNLYFKIEKLKDKRTVTTYYLNGNIKSIEEYIKNQKHGDWYFYSETGHFIKKEVYKRGKLKQQILNNL